MVGAAYSFQILRGRGSFCLHSAAEEARTPLPAGRERLWLQTPRPLGHSTASPCGLAQVILTSLGLSFLLCDLKSSQTRMVCISCPSISFYKSGNCSAEMLSDLPSVTQVANGRTSRGPDLVISGHCPSGKLSFPSTSLWQVFLEESNSFQ